MRLDGREVMVCSCRGTMPIDGPALARACGAPHATIAHELCRAELPRFTAAARTGTPLLVACTQEAPTFRAEAPTHPELRFVNIRETAGWSDEAASALPKIAALLAATPTDAGPRGEVALKSDGVTLIYGRDEVALAAAEQLKDRLDLTVILTGDADVTPPAVWEYPVVRGTIARCAGHLGAFELLVDGFAAPLPSSRAAMRYGEPRDGAHSRCDLILDLSGLPPLVAGHTHREGYLRASPDDPLAVAKMLLAAADLTGSFTKPRYVALRENLCAYSRSGQIGCTRCLDACPAGAIAPAGDSVAIDPHLCAGCGNCAAVCPTAAAVYVEPAAQATARRLRTLLGAYRAAGGVRPPVLLLHAEHGSRLIDALARDGSGLPAHVIPLATEGQWGLDAHATAVAFGAADIVVLAASRDLERGQAALREAALLNAVTEGLGLGARLQLVALDDPFELAAALAALEIRLWLDSLATHLPTGEKTALTTQALDALHRAASTPPDMVPLPMGAPIGRIHVDTSGCTLCLACVSVCPTSALRDHAERPMVRFVEDLCVQCGLCRSTCPEHVITLEPRASFGPARRAEIVLNEEAPAHCVACAKPFGTRASIEKVVASLAGKHWMFTDPAIVERMWMCADCRVIAQTRRNLDPYAGPARPATRTTDDYR